MKVLGHIQKASFGVALTLACSAVLATQAGAVQAQPVAGGATDPVMSPNSAGSVYINEPLQGGSLENWELSGYNWTPQHTTVQQNNGFDNSTNTSDCNGTWPKCEAQRNNQRDSQWLTMTTDNTRNGQGEASTALHSQAISSELGVVLEYDQRLYRTNNGHMGGNPAVQGGGDGIGVYLADANPPNYGNPNVDTSPNEAGGYGAGLGYSAVSNTGDAWCPAQQGVAGGYIGIGFDVYGNYQKADLAGFAFDANVRATRPESIAGGHPSAFPTDHSAVSSSRVPQSIGLRGSGIRFNSAPDCNTSLLNAYGALEKPLVTNPEYHTIFQVKWNPGEPASQYEGYYKTAEADVQVIGEEVPAELLPPGFDDPRGYVMFRVPSSIPSFDFWYNNNGQGISEDFRNITQDVSLGNAPSYTPLNTIIGGYRWLDGTDNLSAYPNPTTPDRNSANEAAIHGAVIDNTKGDSQEYRRIRITLTPDGNGSGVVRLYWSQKLNVADDVCYSSTGAELPDRYADGNTDTCVSPAVGQEPGTWHYDRTKPLEFEEMFSYDLRDNDAQAKLPDDFRIGFSASTGWAVNHHQIRNINVTSVIDLEVEKKVAFIGDSTSPDSDTAWLDEDTGVAGENVAYQIVAWNNGLGDMQGDYPATLTDGLSQAPFQDVDKVQWTATAKDGASICEKWNDAELSCDSWVTKLSGHGPLTDASPLRWVAPSQTNATAKDAAVTVTFVGAVSDGDVSSPEIVSGTWYDNTAKVAASVHGGPREDDLSNNSDAAQIRVVPQLQVNKHWVVNGETYLDGEQPEGLKAELTLSPKPDGLGDDDAPKFGEVYSYPIDQVNQNVGIGEVASAPSGCTVDGEVTSINGTAASDEVPYDHLISAKPIRHVIDITNTVTCQSLTLRKTVVNPADAISATGSPEDWVLSADTAEGDSTINEAPSVEIPGVDKGVSLQTKTALVAAGDYKLSESATTGESADLAAYAPRGDWDCTYPDPRPQNPDAVANAIMTSEGVVTVPQGADVTCEISNATAELSVLKWAEADYFDSEDFTLEVRRNSTPTDPAILKMQGSTTLKAENSLLVKPGEAFEITEFSVDEKLPYLQKAFERYAPSDACPADPDKHHLADPRCWEAVDDAGNVSVEAGERGIYRFVNVAPSRPDLPLTGGPAANTFVALGLVVIMGGLCGALITKWRGRVHN